MNTFFTSDLHFGHKNILKYGRSEFFTDLDHMREVIIQNWNALVEPDDLVYVLGDLVMGQRAENLPVLNRLNGRKILILGNHDYPHPCNKDSLVEKYTPTYLEYFDEMHVRVELELANRKVLLCHFPAAGDHTEDERYPAFRPTDWDEWIMHGHLHTVKINVAPKHIHVGIDADWGHVVPRYSPIPLSAVESAIRFFDGETVVL